MEIYIESNIYVHTHTRTHTGAPGQKIRIQARATPAVAGSGKMFFPFFFSSQPAPLSPVLVVFVVVFISLKNRALYCDFTS